MAIDRTGRTPGRGAYVCRTTECMTNAIDRRALTRALGVATPAGLADELAAMIQTNEGGGRGQE
jgi:predicted RNA-binding protein YlxR (DUF448 family)